MISEGGTIATVTIHAFQTVDAITCYNLGEECIKNLLCKVTECTITNSTIFINWIW